MKIPQETLRTWLEAAGLGAVAGLRSMLPPATVAARLRAGGHETAGSNVARRLLRTPAVATGLQLGAALELVGDKLPFIPARTTALPLIGRAAWGALVAVAWTNAKRPATVAAAALLGGGMAVGATFGAYEVRRRATLGRGGLGKFVAGALEDLLAVASVYLTSRPPAAAAGGWKSRRSKGYVFH